MLFGILRFYSLKFLFRTLLLNVKGPKSWDDLKTVVIEIDNIPRKKVMTTFDEACRARGLFEDDAIFERSLSDAEIQYMSDRQLQHYFAMLLAHSRPADPQKLFDQFLDRLLPPKPANENSEPKSVEERRLELLCNLEYYLRTIGSSCRFLLFF